MAGDHREDPLAYGDYYPEKRRAQGKEDGEIDQGGERGVIGDAYRKFHGMFRPQQQDPVVTGSSQNVPTQPTGGQQSSSGPGSSLFDKLHGAVHGLGSEFNQRFAGRHSASAPDNGPAGLGGLSGNQRASNYRYGSFAQPTTGNDVKWYVDGCGYMWAVSRALEEARESIWILDCKGVKFFARLESKANQWKLRL